MKVSEKQLIMLTDILKATLPIGNSIGGYDQQTRLQLATDLINQQSNDLREVECEQVNNNQDDCDHRGSP